MYQEIWKKSSFTNHPPVPHPTSNSQKMASVYSKHSSSHYNHLDHGACDRLTESQTSVKPWTVNPGLNSSHPPADSLHTSTSLSRKYNDKPSHGLKSTGESNSVCLLEFYSKSKVHPEPPALNIKSGISPLIFCKQHTVGKTDHSLHKPDKLTSLEMKVNSTSILKSQRDCIVQKRREERQSFEDKMMEMEDQLTQENMKKRMKKAKNQNCDSLTETSFERPSSADVMCVNSETYSDTNVISKGDRVRVKKKPSHNKDTSLDTFQSECRKHYDQEKNTNSSEDLEYMNHSYSDKRLKGNSHKRTNSQFLKNSSDLAKDVVAGLKLEDAEKSCNVKTSFEHIAKAPPVDCGNVYLYCIKRSYRLKHANWNFPSKGLLRLLKRKYKYLKIMFKRKPVLCLERCDMDKILRDGRSVRELNNISDDSRIAESSAIESTGGDRNELGTLVDPRVMSLSKTLISSNNGITGLAKTFKKHSPTASVETPQKAKSSQLGKKTIKPDWIRLKEKLKAISTKPLKKSNNNHDVRENWNKMNTTGGIHVVSKVPLLSQIRNVLEPDEKQSEEYESDHAVDTEENDGNDSDATVIGYDNDFPNVADIYELNSELNGDFDGESNYTGENQACNEKRKTNEEEVEFSNAGDCSEATDTVTDYSKKIVCSSIAMNDETHIVNKVHDNIFDEVSDLIRMEPDLSNESTDNLPNLFAEENEDIIIDDIACDISPPVLEKAVDASPVHDYGGLHSVYLDFKIENPDSPNVSDSEAEHKTSCERNNHKQSVLNNEVLDSCIKRCDKVSEEALRSHSDFRSSNQIPVENVEVGSGKTLKTRNGKKKLSVLHESLVSEPASRRSLADTDKLLNDDKEINKQNSTEQMDGILNSSTQIVNSSLDSTPEDLISLGDNTEKINGKSENQELFEIVSFYHEDVAKECSDISARDEEKKSADQSVDVNDSHLEIGNSCLDKNSVKINCRSIGLSQDICADSASDMDSNVSVVDDSNSEYKADSQSETGNTDKEIFDTENSCFTNVDDDDNDMKVESNQQIAEECLKIGDDIEGTESGKEMKSDYMEITSSESANDLDNCSLPDIESTRTSGFSENSTEQTSLLSEDVKHTPASLGHSSIPLHTPEKRSNQTAKNKSQGETMEFSEERLACDFPNHNWLFNKYNISPPEFAEEHVQKKTKKSKNVSRRNQKIAGGENDKCLPAKSERMDKNTNSMLTKCLFGFKRDKTNIETNFKFEWKRKKKGKFNSLCKKVLNRVGSVEKVFEVDSNASTLAGGEDRCVWFEENARIENTKSCIISKDLQSTSFTDQVYGPLDFSSRHKNKDLIKCGLLGDCQETSLDLCTGKHRKHVQTLSNANETEIKMEDVATAGKVGDEIVDSDEEVSNDGSEDSAEASDIRKVVQCVIQDMSNSVVENDRRNSMQTFVDLKEMDEALIEEEDNTLTGTKDGCSQAVVTSSVEDCHNCSDDGSGEMPDDNDNGIDHDDDDAPKLEIDEAESDEQFEQTTAVSERSTSVEKTNKPDISTCEPSLLSSSAATDSVSIATTDSVTETQKDDGECDLEARPEDSAAKKIDGAEVNFRCKAKPLVQLVHPQVHKPLAVSDHELLPSLVDSHSVQPIGPPQIPVSSTQDCLVPDSSAAVNSSLSRNNNSSMLTAYTIQDGIFSSRRLESSTVLSSASSTYGSGLVITVQPFMQNVKVSTNQNASSNQLANEISDTFSHVTSHVTQALVMQTDTQTLTSSTNFSEHQQQQRLISQSNSLSSQRDVPLTLPVVQRSEILLSGNSDRDLSDAVMSPELSANRNSTKLLSLHSSVKTRTYTQSAVNNQLMTASLSTKIQEQSALSVTGSSNVVTQSCDLNAPIDGDIDDEIRRQMEELDEEIKRKEREQEEMRQKKLELLEKVRLSKLGSKPESVNKDASCKVTDPEVKEPPVDRFETAAKLETKALPDLSRKRKHSEDRGECDMKYSTSTSDTSVENMENDQMEVTSTDTINRTNVLPDEELSVSVTDGVISIRDKRMDCKSISEITMEDSIMDLVLSKNIAVTESDCSNEYKPSISMLELGGDKIKADAAVHVHSNEELSIEGDDETNETMEYMEDEDDDKLLIEEYEESDEIDTDSATELDLSIKNVSNLQKVDNVTFELGNAKSKSISTSDVKSEYFYSDTDSETKEINSTVSIGLNERWNVHTDISEGESESALDLVMSVQSVCRIPTSGIKDSCQRILSDNSTESPSPYNCVSVISVASPSFSTSSVNLSNNSEVSSSLSQSLNMTPSTALSTSSLSSSVLCSATLGGKVRSSSSTTGNDYQSFPVHERMNDSIEVRNNMKDRNVDSPLICGPLNLITHSGVVSSEHYSLNQDKSEVFKKDVAKCLATSHTASNDESQSGKSSVHSHLPLNIDHQVNEISFVKSSSNDAVGENELKVGQNVTCTQILDSPHCVPGRQGNKSRKNKMVEIKAAHTRPLQRKVKMTKPLPAHIHRTDSLEIMKKMNLTAYPTPMSILQSSPHFRRNVPNFKTPWDFKLLRKPNEKRRPKPAHLRRPFGIAGHLIVSSNRSRKRTCSDESSSSSCLSDSASGSPNPPSRVLSAPDSSHTPASLQRRLSDSLETSRASVVSSPYWTTNIHSREAPFRAHSRPMSVVSKEQFYETSVLRPPAIQRTRSQANDRNEVIDLTMDEVTEKKVFDNTERYVQLELNHAMSKRQRLDSDKSNQRNFVNQTDMIECADNRKEPDVLQKVFVKPPPPYTGRQRMPVLAQFPRQQPFDLQRTSGTRAPLNQVHTGGNQNASVPRIQLNPRGMIVRNPVQSGSVANPRFSVQQRPVEYRNLRGSIVQSPEFVGQGQMIQQGRVISPRSKVLVSAQNTFVNAPLKQPSGTSTVLQNGNIVQAPAPRNISADGKQPDLRIISPPGLTHVAHSNKAIPVYHDNGVYMKEPVSGRQPVLMSQHSPTVQQSFQSKHAGSVHPRVPFQSPQVYQLLKRPAGPSHGVINGSEMAQQHQQLLQQKRQQSPLMHGQTSPVSKSRVMLSPGEIPSPSMTAAYASRSPKMYPDKGHVIELSQGQGHRRETSQGQGHSREICQVQGIGYPAQSQDVLHLRRNATERLQSPDEMRSGQDSGFSNREYNAQEQKSTSKDNPHLQPLTEDQKFQAMHRIRAQHIRSQQLQIKKSLAPPVGGLSDNPSIAMRNQGGQVSHLGPRFSLPQPQYQQQQLVARQQVPSVPTINPLAPQGMRCPVTSSDPSARSQNRQVTMVTRSPVIGQGHVQNIAQISRDNSMNQTTKSAQNSLVNVQDTSELSNTGQTALGMDLSVSGQLVKNEPMGPSTSSGYHDNQTVQGHLRSVPQRQNIQQPSVDVPSGKNTMVWQSETYPQLLAQHNGQTQEMLVFQPRNPIPSLVVNQQTAHHSGGNTTVTQNRPILPKPNNVGVCTAVNVTSQAVVTMATSPIGNNQCTQPVQIVSHSPDIKPLIVSQPSPLGVKILQSTQELRMSPLNKGQIEGILEGDLPHLQQVHGACYMCGKYSLYLCSNCKEIWYCSPECQLTHWQTHAKECGKPAA